MFGTTFYSTEQLQIFFCNIFIPEANIETLSKFTLLETKLFFSENNTLKGYPNLELVYHRMLQHGDCLKCNRQAYKNQHFEIQHQSRILELSKIEVCVSPIRNKTEVQLTNKTGPLSSKTKWADKPQKKATRSKVIDQPPKPRTSSPKVIPIPKLTKKESLTCKYCNTYFTYTGFFSEAFFSFKNYTIF